MRQGNSLKKIKNKIIQQIWNLKNKAHQKVNLKLYCYRIPELSLRTNTKVSGMSERSNYPKSQVQTLLMPKILSMSNTTLKI